MKPWTIIPIIGATEAPTDFYATRSEADRAAAAKGGALRQDRYRAIRTRKIQVMLT